MRKRLARRMPEGFLIGSILLVAFALRASCITWGLPLNDYTGYYHPDEGKIVRGAMNFPVDILHRQDLRYPTFFHYAIGTLTLPVRFGIRQLAPDMPEEKRYLLHYVIARSCSVLLGTLTVLATYRLGRHLYGETTGLLAAGLVAISKMHVTYSSWAQVDVATSFFAVLALSRCYALIDKPTLGSYALLGLVSGVLIGTKYTGAAILVPAVIAHVVAQWPSERERVSLARPLLRLLSRSWLLVVLLGVTAAVFLATTPSILIRPRSLASAFQFEASRLARGGRDLLDLSMWQELVDCSMWWTLWGKLGTQVLGIPLAFIAVLGVCAALLTPLSRDALPCAFVLGYSLVMGSQTKGRYTLIVLPFLCLYAARLLTRIRSLSGKAVSTAITWAVIGAAFVFTLTAIYARLSPDTRALAAQYVAEQIPPGRSIGIGDVGNYKRESWQLPRLPRDRYVLTDCLYEPDYIVLSSRDYEEMEDALDSSHLRDYVWNKEQAGYWFPGEIPSPEVFHLYDDLLGGTTRWHDYELMAAFKFHSPVYLSSSPPEIRIYRHAGFEPRFLAPPTEMQNGLRANLGDKAVLVGFDAPAQAQSSGSLQITLYWQASQLIDTSYTVFVHLVDADWRMWSQSDSLPANGKRPTTNWLESEVIPDAHTLPIPAEIPPGTCRLEVGMYHAITHQRLRVYGVDHQDLGSSIILSFPVVVVNPPEAL